LPRRDTLAVSLRPFECGIMGGDEIDNRYESDFCVHRDSFLMPHSILGMFNRGFLPRLTGI